MNDELLAPAVGDWLKSSDTPPRDARASVRSAVTRARETKQAGRWWPRPTLSIGPSSGGPAAITAVMALILIGSAFVVALLPRGDDAPSSLAGATASAEPVGTEPRDGALHWETDVVDLRASSFTLDVNDLVFTTGGQPLAVHSDPGDAQYWTLEVEWGEHGLEQRWYVYFASDGRDWWVSEMRTRDGYDPAEWVYAFGPFFKAPLGETYEGDARIELVGEGRPGEPGRVVEGTLAIDGLRLSVTPGEGPNGRPSAQGSTESNAIIDGLRSIRDIFFPRPERTPRPKPPAGPAVEVDYGELTLVGELLDDGVVRITDDGAGNKLTPVASVAVGDDGTVWVARHKIIFALGRPGQAKAGARGPQQSIERIEANSDGSLTVHADGVWRLEGGEWTRVEPPRRPIPTYDPEGHHTIWELPDGSVWRLPLGGTTDASIRDNELPVGLRQGDGWLEFKPDEYFPAALERFPDEDLTPWALLSTPDGDVWINSHRSLSRFRDGSWEETTPGFLESLAGGGPIFIREALLEEDGTLWVLVQGGERNTGPDAIHQLLRMSDEAWSSFSLEGVLPPDSSTSYFYGLDRADGVGVRLLENDRDLDYYYDDPTGLARRNPLTLHDPVTGLDGTTWGTARPRSKGLLMIPATEPVLIEEVSD